MIWKAPAVDLLSTGTSICCMVSVKQHDNSSHFPFSLFNSARLFLAHKAGLAVGYYSLPQAWRSCVDVFTLCPYGGQRHFIKTKTLQQGYTPQIYQAVSSLSLWMTILPSFSITLKTDKSLSGRSGRSVLPFQPHRCQSDFYTLSAQLIAKPQQRDFNGLH